MNKGFKEDKYLDWLDCYQFGIGYDRYCYFSKDWGFIAAALPTNHALAIEDVTCELSMVDMIAYNAMEQIKKHSKFIGINKNPSLALKEVIDKLREYYINEVLD